MSTKLQFIVYTHVSLTATCSDVQIENSKNHKKVILFSSTLTLRQCAMIMSRFCCFDVQVTVYKLQFCTCIIMNRGCILTIVYDDHTTAIPADTILQINNVTASFNILVHCDLFLHAALYKIQQAVVRSWHLRSVHRWCQNSEVHVNVIEL